jgi:hypothetical protein
MSNFGGIATKFKLLDKLFYPILIVNVVALAFSLPGIIKFSEMVFGPNETNVYDLNDTTQCIRSKSGLSFEGNWFHWLRASTILTMIISVINVIAIFIAGSDKPGESDSLFGKISIFLNMMNITIITIISFVLFNSVNITTMEEPPVEGVVEEGVEETPVEEPPIVQEPITTEVLEAFQQIENGDYCFHKLFNKQNLALKIFLGLWISLYGLGMIFTLLAIRPISSSELSNLVTSKQQSAKAQLLI